MHYHVIFVKIQEISIVNKKKRNQGLIVIPIANRDEIREKNEKMTDLQQCTYIHEDSGRKFHHHQIG